MPAVYVFACGLCTRETPDEIFRSIATLTVTETANVYALCWRWRIKIFTMRKESKTKYVISARARIELHSWVLNARVISFTMSIMLHSKANGTLYTRITQSNLTSRYFARRVTTNRWKRVVGEASKSNDTHETPNTQYVSVIFFFIVLASNRRKINIKHYTEIKNEHGINYMFKKNRRKTSERFSFNNQKSHLRFWSWWLFSHSALFFSCRTSN